MFTIVQVNVGRRAFLGKTRNTAGDEVDVYSALVKRRIEESYVNVGPLGVEGDEQADTEVVKGKQVHGGLLKAICAMTLGTQALWHKELGELVTPGAAFGENLTLAGARDELDEEHVFLGDEYECNGVRLRVAGVRRPCFKLGIHLGAEVPRRMAYTGWSGWYFEVLHAGVLPTAGGQLSLVSRRNDALSIADVFRRKMVASPQIPGLRD